MDLAELVSESRLKRFRNRAYMAIGFVIAPFLLPFTFYDLLTGQELLYSAIIFLIVLVLCVNSIYILKFQTVLISYRYFFTALQALLIWSIAHEGAYTALWSFPIALITMFTEKRAAVRVMLLGSLICVAPVVLHFHENAFALRYLVSYSMVIMCADLLLGLLDQMQSDLNAQAIRDPLTGVYNRRQLMSTLREVIGVNRGGASQHCLISIDIDHFKSVNDDFGHDMGDRVIQDVASSIVERVRDTDLLFRVGGEEFILLVSDASQDRALTIAESIRERIEEIEFIKDRTVTVSLGVAGYRHGEDIRAWLKRVDENLYKAKQSGRNCVYGTRGVNKPIGPDDDQDLSFA